MAKLFQAKRVKKRVTATLAVAMAATLSFGLLTACTDGTNDNGGSEDESNVAKTDTQLLKNGNFEFYTDQWEDELNKKINLISSPNSWSGSYASANGSSAPSSEGKSGIVNVSEEEWKNLTTPGRGFSSKEDALAHWEDDDVTAYDRIKFYDEYDIDSSSDFEFYDDYKYTVDFDDVEYFYDSSAETENDKKRVKNPGTSKYREEENAKDSENAENSVLMIQNRKTTSSNVYGTAYYYSSSTALTIQAGTAAEFSVWVKTSNLVHHDNLTATEGAGAYIGITNTVGGTTLDQLQVKNINTEVQSANTDANGWANYKFYVKASEYATTTVKITLGLGMGSTNDVNELVNGYAFFDDLTCTMISEKDYTDKTAGVTTRDIHSTGDERKFDADTVDEKQFALDLSAPFKALSLNSATIEITSEKSSGQVYYPSDYGMSFDESLDVKELKTLSALNGNTNADLQKILTKDFAKFPFDKDNDEILMLMSKSGAPYTATVESATVGGDDAFTLAPKKQMLVTFFVKTSEMHGFAGAGISVVDGKTKSTIASFDSTKVDAIDLDDDNKDIYDGWVRCYFFLSNDTEDTKTFSLQFTYGTTTIINSTKDKYLGGYAAFTNFRTYPLTSYEAGYATTGTYAQKVSLTSVEPTETQFDSVANHNPDAIKTDMANTSNYWGIVGNDPLVGGTAEKGQINKAPEGVFAGLVNSKYADAYYANKDVVGSWQEMVSKQVGTTTNAIEWWSKFFGSADQPLAIINLAQTTSYGYIARSDASLSASSAQRISVRVKVSANAKAYVYLVAEDEDEGFKNNLGVNMPNVTYFYDDEGNITAKDPSDKDFDEKNDIAYKLGKNGLYTNAKDENDKKFYANLANYEKDDDGNLVTSDGAIAFYAKDGKFYAYHDETAKTYTTEVIDFPATFKQESARYDYTDLDKGKYETYIVVDGNDAADKWVTVSFNINTGVDAKTYRLEVWSGSRDNTVQNPANSYVLFDKVKTETMSNYASLLNEAVDMKKEELKLADPTFKTSDDFTQDPNYQNYALYYTYTFYDDVDYLRYDETTDTDDNGNPYEAYKQSEKTEGLAYFYFEDTQTLPSEPNYRMFLDYSLTDVEVEKATTDDTTEDTEETEDTTIDAANLLLLSSSIALVAVLALVIVSIFVRRVLKNYRRTHPARERKPRKEKKEKPVKEEAPAKKKKERDENDPYNE